MRLLAPLVFLAASLVASANPAPDGGGGAAAQLRATHASLRDRLAKNPFNQPLVLESREDDEQLKGDAYAVIDHPFAETSRALAESAQWCEVLMLPFNVKNCEAPKGGAQLVLYVGRKSSTPLERSHKLDFHFRTASRGSDYLRVVLNAPQGPFSTRDYEIVFELVPLDERRSFLHLGYTYGYGTFARAALQTYLSTIGAKKVGFSVEGRDDQGKPYYVRGLRGVMERNTMRYYLAIEAYLKAQRAAPEDRATRMIEEWFASIERYPRQLHELERDDYVPMKAKEFERMRAGINPAPRTASSSP
jgi:hypothetical protein